LAWFDKGLSFTCQGCSHCCSGEPGFVFLSSEEIDALSEHLEMNREDFLSCYCRKVDRGECYAYTIRERADYSCIFLKDKRCEVYPVRPLQCSTYPFWDYLMKDRALWENEKNECPGIGKGEHHPASEIREKLKKGALHKIYCQNK